MNKIKLWVAQSSLFAASLAVGARLFFVSVAFAQSTPVNGGVTDSTSLKQLVCNIAAYFFWVVIVVAVIMVLYAAFEYATGGDDTEKTTKARRILTYAAVGIAVAIIAYSLPAIVGSIFPTPVSGTSVTSC